MCAAKVIVAGLTVPIDISDIENQTVASEAQAKVVAIALTNKLHSLGYTTSYVQRYTLDGDVCLLYVVESRIADIQLISDTDIKESIMQDLQKLKGAVYNKKDVHVFLVQLKEKYVLDSINVNVINYNQGNDVQLIVRIRAKTLVYSFEVATVPIYGITPSLMLSIPLYNAIASAHGQIGFNKERVTEKKGILDYLHYSGVNGWHAGINIAQEYAVWERYKADFTLTLVKPFLGIGIFHSVGVFDISSFIYGVATYFRVSEYDNTVLQEKLSTTYNNGGLELKVKATDSRSIVKKNKDFNLSIFIGASEDEYIFTSRASVYVPLLVTNRVYIIPSGYSFHTTSCNRVYAEYVFDSYLLGYSSRYTTTHSRHIAKLELMYEVLYEFLFAEVFGTSCVYKTEYSIWDAVSTYGVALDIYYNAVIVNLGSAWNREENFDKLYIFTGIKAQW